MASAGIDRRWGLPLRLASLPLSHGGLRAEDRLKARCRPSAATLVRRPSAPSITDTLLGAIDIMQERIAQARLVGESPDVLLTPRLGHFDPFEYHRAALSIAAGREVVAEMLPVIRIALAG
jgi:NTE family protein